MVRPESAPKVIGRTRFAQGRTFPSAARSPRSYIGIMFTERRGRAEDQAQVIALRPADRTAPKPTRSQPRRAAPVREPLWRHVVGDVLRRERLAQRRTLKDVSEAARISMPYLSELERGLKEASSEILAAAGRALGLSLVELLARSHQSLVHSTLGQLAPARTARQLTSNGGLSSGRPVTDADAAVTSVGELGTRHTSASGVSQASVSLAA